MRHFISHQAKSRAKLYHSQNHINGIIYGAEHIQDITFDYENSFYELKMVVQPFFSYKVVFRSKRGNVA